MSSDNQYTALGPAAVGFQTDGANIAKGAQGGRHAARRARHRARSACSARARAVRAGNSSRTGTSTRRSTCSRTRWPIPASR
jgi:hypothetical protein